MDPTTYSIKRILPFNLTEEQSKISNKNNKSNLLIEVLKKNHEKLKQESEIKNNSVSNQEIVPLNSEIQSSDSSSINDGLQSKLRKRTSKYDLIKRTTDIVNQRNAERESKLPKTESNVTSISTSFTCTLL